MSAITEWTGFVIVAAAFAWLFHWAVVNDQSRREQRVATYSKLHACEHIGYAGQHNTNKMYKCNTGIKLDVEM